MSDPNEPDPWQGTDEEVDDDWNQCPICGALRFDGDDCCGETDFDDDVSANTNGDIAS